MGNQSTLVISTLSAILLLEGVSLVTSVPKPWHHPAHYRVQSSDVGLVSLSGKQNVDVDAERLIFGHQIRGGADVEEDTSVEASETKTKSLSETQASETEDTCGAESKTKASSPAKPKPKKSKKSKLSEAAREHLSKSIKSTNPNYRIQRELKEFLRDPPPGLRVQIGKNLRVWIVDVKGPGIYEGEKFKLRISFPAQYPTVPPSVYFMKPNLPVGPHFYSNGDICLSLLGKDWRPTMTAQSIALSILSMLASNQSKTLPMDNAAHAKAKPGQYQKDWVYHDDSC